MPFSEESTAGRGVGTKRPEVSRVEVADREGRGRENVMNWAIRDAAESRDLPVNPIC